jgi:hypothetical protein
MSKRLFSMTLALVLSVATFAMAAEDKKTTETAKAPRLTIVEPLKDFGTVPKGEKIDWAFEVKNTGNADLEIIAAKPTCGCTVADFDKIIKPGQSGKVSAHVDTTNFGGPISKAVTLETNDPNTPTAQVTITAVVKPYVEAYPAGYVRYNMLQGDVEKQSVTLYSEEDEPFQILKVESPQEWIKVEQKKNEGADVVPQIGKKDQTQYKLDITVGGDEARIGPIAEKVHIVTNSKHQPDYWVGVSGVIRPSYRVDPTGINFGEIAPNDSAATRTITVRTNAKNPADFSVTKVESGVAGVTAAVAPTANAGEYEVTLKVAKEAKAGILDGNVTIYTSDKAKPTVVIPVKGTIKPAA